MLFVVRLMVCDVVLSCRSLRLFSDMAMAMSTLKNITIVFRPAVMVRWPVPLTRSTDSIAVCPLRSIRPVVPRSPRLVTNTAPLGGSTWQSMAICPWL